MKLAASWKRAFGLAAVALLLWTGPAAANGEWFVSLYGGQYSDTPLIDILRFSTDFEGSHIYVFSVGRTLATWRNRVGLEWEGQVATHTGQQDHQEINAALTLRWLSFPWDRHVDTSFAFGNGISYATEDPPLEIRESGEDRTAQWLYYILVEWAFAVPTQPRWDLFVRIHHRSSAFGLVDGISTGSNFVGLGIRYRFR